MSLFKSLWIEESDGEYSQSIAERNIEDLPEGEVLIKVAYSSLNYKDALSAHGNKGVTRNFPHQPGIDAVGTVEASQDEQFATGENVLVTGFDLGMNTAGGLGQYIRVPSSWVLKLPENLSAERSMAFGTAGLTAQLCINKLLRMGLDKSQGPVLVTGATGGVGSIAVALMANAGFEVHASSGKPESSEYLKSLGASEVIGRGLFSEENKRPMLKETYAAAIDVVGGNTLANVLKQIKHSGSVACCGLVESTDLPASVLPHILRGVNLLGVDSVEISLAEKATAWEAIGNAGNIPAIGLLNEKISLSQVIEKLQSIYQGKASRHYIVDMKIN